MAAHPDGSGRAFLYTQDGKIWIASVPARGSGAPMQLAGDGVVPFVDLTGRALQLLGLAPHPGFATNCRFFISFACDAIASPACGTGTSSSPAAGGYAGSSKPWRYQLVVEEFTAKNVGYGMTDRAAPTEVRRIFTMGLPQPVDASNHQHGSGGQIFFRPGHGYLYLVTGHGGAGDEEVTSPFLGKIIRFDVGLSTGNEPQIFATGISDPRGCSFDCKRPSYLYCAGVDEQQNQQVYLISNKASNYSASPAATKATVSIIIGHGRPTAGKAPSIVGGIVYRGPADPFLSGRYLYMYGSSMWAAAAGTPAPAINALRVYVRCSGSSPVPCGSVAIAGSIVSLAQDNSEDAFIIATGGIYRVIPPGLCGGAPRPRAREPPLQNNAGTSWLVWAASIILGSAVTAPSAIYPVYLCLCGRRSEGGGEGEGINPRAINLGEVTLICCCSRGMLRNCRSNAPSPTGGQGGGSTTGSQVELQAVTPGFKSKSECKNTCAPGSSYTHASTQ